MTMLKMLQKYFTGLLMVGAVLALGACGDNTSGPEDIHWDRDTCELCKMLISDHRFAAEVRGGEDRKIYKFDDIGCAINWLNDQEWAGDKTVEIWVVDYTSTRENVVWLNAREARYVGGELTPMNYGFKAVAAPVAAPEGAQSNGQGIGFVEMTTQILAENPNHICLVPKK